MQTNNQRLLDLEVLPEEARKTLIEFYDYLMDKYKHQTLTFKDKKTLR